MRNRGPLLAILLILAHVAVGTALVALLAPRDPVLAAKQRLTPPWEIVR